MLTVVPPVRVAPASRLQDARLPWFGVQGTGMAARGGVA